MITVKKRIVTILMVVIWGITVILLFNTTHSKGFFSILFSGIFINVLLAVYYSCLGQRIVSLRDWLSR
ncbi:hypothetical protein M0L20_06855 [Spirosoma sp. RP8]|uniref:Uncharacterized protein n=1 Tax=Spirosoma liriopis TaxID=2937440 RepID=A0ABT0HHC3_9BACT|nr:hypothetical protein [Spirosoma liriopis]MCK8491567.1 hypothetical protein [Spirosoma liriopis]